MTKFCRWPLKEDGIRNLLEAQRQLKSRNEPVLLLPVAIFYEVEETATPDLEQAVARLERSTGIASGERSLPPRVRALVQTALEQLERYYGTSSRRSSLDKQLLDLCRHATLSVASFTGIEAAKTESEARLLYSVRGALRKHLFKGHPRNYAERLNQQAMERARFAVNELNRIQQLLILCSTLQQPFTREAAWRIVDRLEPELLGRNTKKGRRVAKITNGHPVNLLEFVADYESRMDNAVRRIDFQLRKEILAAMAELKRQEPVFHDAA
jgi:hypothetical protein